MTFFHRIAAVTITLALAGAGSAQQLATKRALTLEVEEDVVAVVEQGPPTATVLIPRSSPMATATSEPGS